MGTPRRFDPLGRDTLASRVPDRRGPRSTASFQRTGRRLMRGRRASPPSRKPVRQPRKERRTGTHKELCHDISEEHTSELQSLMRTSYAVFCLKKKKEPANRSQAITNND